MEGRVEGVRFGGQSGAEMESVERPEQRGGGARGDTSWPLRGTLWYTRRAKEIRCADLIRESSKKVAYTQQADSPCMTHREEPNKSSEKVLNDKF